MKKTYIINDEYVGSRVDRWFRKNIINIPQSLIEKSFRKGKIKINSKKNKTSYKLKKNDVVIINNLNFKEIKKKFNFQYRPTKKDISSSYSIFIENNENFVVINKPSGVAVQSGTKSKRNILDILRSTKEFLNTQPYSVHRIDKETTGLLIVAKNRKYAQIFTSLFRKRKIHKIYLGIVIGELENKNGTYIDNLFYYEGDKKIITKAITKYEVLDSNYNYSLLLLEPLTGRKHQLRKQLLMHGHPILGDTKYRFLDSKIAKKNHLMLHAYKVNFSIDGVKFKFAATLPIEFKDSLNQKHLKIS